MDPGRGSVEGSRLLPGRGLGNTSGSSSFRFGGALPWRRLRVSRMVFRKSAGDGESGQPGRGSMWEMVSKGRGYPGRGSMWFWGRWGVRAGHPGGGPCGSLLSFIRIPALMTSLCVSSACECSPRV